MDTAPRLPRGRGTASAVDRMLSYIACLRRSPSLFFIPLVPHPARFARHLPHAGKALCRGYPAIPIQPTPLRGTSFQRKEGVSTLAPSYGRGCRAQRGGVGLLFGAAKPPPLCLPHTGKAVLSLCHHPQPALPLRGQAKEAQEASCASLIGMHFPAEIRCIHCLMSFRIAAEGKTALPEVFLFADIAFDRPAIEESADIEE